MVIACVAYGSLVWNPKPLKLSSEWHKDGPFLPVELTDHEKTKMCFTLTSGARPVQTLWATMPTEDITVAIEKLSKRERMSPWELVDCSIGYWTRRKNRGICSHTIGEWAMSKNIDGVVWTALEPRFRGDVGKTPTLSEVIAFLRSLIEAGTEANAKEYVVRSPIRTKYTRAIRREFNW